MSAKLAIVGSYPPPYGGVGVHVQRLCALLDERGIDYRVYNATSDVGDGKRVLGVFHRRRSWMLKYAITGKEPVVYIMSDRMAAWIVGGLMAALRGKRVAIRLRNAALPDWIAKSTLKRMLAQWTLRRMRAVVGVSRLLIDSAASLGVPANRLHWSPGFLPPTPGDVDPQMMAPAVREFISQHAPIISANGKIDRYNGVDLYGLDHCIELAARLRTQYPNVGVVFCFGDFHPSEQPRLDELLDQARRAGVENNVLLHTTPGAFVPVLAASDVFIRPSNTDGDAISVREALYLGVPTIASDAVARPAGAKLFPTRNVDAMTSAVESVLTESQTGPRQRTVALAPEDRERIDRYLDLLQSLAD